MLLISHDLLLILASFQKPRNLLVNSGCELKLCDFGLARFEDDDDRVVMSDYVATRWYRSPEVVERKGYSKPGDIWAVGCILGELLCRKPLFPGNNGIFNYVSFCFCFVLASSMHPNNFVAASEIHQLHLIRTMLGMSEDGKKPGRSKKGLRPHSSLLKKIKQRAPNANPLALDLMVKLLAWDPKERFTVEQALKHEYLTELHEAEDEPACKPLDPALFEFERRHTTKEQLRGDGRNTFIVVICQCFLSYIAFANRSHLE